MPNQVLSSWKEIAGYVGRGVRTVQRWEKNFGFPVRRPKGEGRGAVLAFPSEIDAWLHRRTGSSHAKSPAGDNVRENWSTLQSRASTLVRTAQQVGARTRQLKEHLAKTFSEYRRLSQKSRKKT